MKTKIKINMMPCFMLRKSKTPRLFFSHSLNEQAKMSNTFGFACSCMQASMSNARYYSALCLQRNTTTCVATNKIHLCFARSNHNKNWCSCGASTRNFSALCGLHNNNQNVIDPFTAPIPWDYIRDKGKPLLAVFSVRDLYDFNLFTSKIKSI